MVRGAYGVFYQRGAACTWIGLSVNPPFIRSGDAVLSVNQTSYQEFPLNDLTPVVNFVAPGSKPAVTGINVDYHVSYVQQWNFYIDHTFAQDLVVKAGYVGNHGIGLQRYNYPNEPTPAAGDVQSRRPFQNLGSVTEFWFTGQSNYQGLELQAQKRYTQRPFDHFLVHLVEGPGRHHAARPVVRRELEGSLRSQRWQALLVCRGLRASVWHGPADSGAGLPSRRCDLWRMAIEHARRSAHRSPAERNDSRQHRQHRRNYASAECDRSCDLARDQQTKNRFFNTAAFVAPAPYTLGNSAAEIINGPSFQNLDASLSKSFRIRERTSMQFRTEVFDVLNHPNWGNPGTTLGNRDVRQDHLHFRLGDPRMFQFGLKLLF